MASAGKRCHINVWLSESFCILNLVRQDFDFITLLCGEGKDATYKGLNSCTGEVLWPGTVGMVLPGESRICHTEGCKSWCHQGITRLMRVR